MQRTNELGLTERRDFYGWKLVGVLFALDFLNMGFPLYGGTVINTYMLKEIAMSRSTYGMGFTLLNLMVGVPSTIVAASILRWGIRRTFGIGSAILCVGAWWLAVAARPWQYLMGFGILLGTGISFGTLVPVSTAATRWFRRYRGRAMAIALSASGIAGFVLSPLVNKILSANGGNWRLAWRVVAGVAVVSAVLAFLFVKESPEELGQEVDGGEVAEFSEATRMTHALATKHAWTAEQAYRTRGYWMIVIGGIASQFPFFFFTAHWILHLKGTGISASDAAWAMALFSIAAVAGRLVGGWLMDRVAARFAFMLGLCCYLAGSVLAVLVDPRAIWISYAAAILYGTGFGWTFVCLNTTTAHFFGPSAFAKLNGLALLLTGVVCAPAGLIGGKLFDFYGNYRAAFGLNMAIAAVGIIAMTIARMPTPPLASAQTR